MEVVVCITPLLLNWLRTVTSKIVKFTKLLKNSFTIEFEPCRIPFNTALPVVVVSVAVLPSFTHDTPSVHTRTRAKLVRNFCHSIVGKVRDDVDRLVV